MTLSDPDPPTWDYLLLENHPHDVGISFSYPLPGTAFYERVRAQLGSKRNWTHSDDLCLMFKAAYTDQFYRALRDALHAEVDSWRTPFIQTNQSASPALLWQKVVELEPLSRNKESTTLEAPKNYLDVKNSNMDKTDAAQSAAEANPGDNGTSDLMDRLLVQWRAARPDLDASPLELVGRVIVLAQHLERSVESALEKHNLTLGQFDILATLRRHGKKGGLTPTQLLESVVAMLTLTPNS